MDKFIFFVLLFFSATVSFALNLKEAERIAMERADEIRQFSLEAQSLEAEAVASGQLPDPVLLINALNVPVNTFNFTQEQMTQVQLGVIQDFPKGHSLKYRYLQTHNQAVSKCFQKELKKLFILKTLREQWNFLYYWQKNRAILLKQRKIFKHLQEVTQSLLANNKAQQIDVLNAQLEVSQINERLIQVNNAIDNTRIELARWIGSRAADKARADSLALTVKQFSIKQLKQSLRFHPLLKQSIAEINAARSAVQLSKQDYLPGLSAGVAYGFRGGKERLGRNRPDMLTGLLTVSVPLFPANKQDKRMLSSHSKLSALREQYQSKYKDLMKQLLKSLKDNEEAEKKIRLYRTKLLPETKQYANSTLISYQNNKSDFIKVAQGHVRWLNVRLGVLREKLNQNQAQINILFLQGK